MLSLTLWTGKLILTFGSELPGRRGEAASPLLQGCRSSPQEGCQAGPVPIGQRSSLRRLHAEKPSFHAIFPLGILKAHQAKAIDLYRLVLLRAFGRVSVL